MPDNKVFNSEEKMKLKGLLTEGIAVKTEVDTLSGGLNDTIKAMAEEMDIKPSVLKKAVNVAYKSGFHDATSDFELLENILVTTGRDL